MRRLIITLCLLLAGVGFSLPLPASAASTSVTTVAMWGEPDTWTGGASFFWRGDLGQVQSRIAGEEIQVWTEPRDAEHAFALILQPQAGTTFVPGDYSAAEDPLVTTRARVSLSLGSSGCHEQRMRFRIHLIDTAAGRLHLTWQHRCGIWNAWTTGEIRVGIPGDSDLLTSAKRLTFRDTPPGLSTHTHRVRVANTSERTVHLTGASVSGSGFRLTSSSCGTLAPGASCSVGVAFRPTAQGTHTGRLTLAADTAAGTHTVSLAGIGIAGLTRWSTRSQPGSSLGRGLDETYRPPAMFTTDGQPGGVRVDIDREVAVDLTAPVGQTLAAGTTYRLAQRFADETHAGLDMSAHSRGCNTSTGEFTVHEIAFDAWGDLARLSASWKGRCTEDSGWLYGTVAWQASVVPPPLPPRLTVATDATTYTHNAGARVAVRITNDTPYRRVRLYQRPLGGAESYVGTATVDSTGRALFAVPSLRRRTTFRAVSASTPDHVEGTRTVAVRARVTHAIVGAYDRRDGWYLVHDHTGRIWDRATVAPNHAGDCIDFELQRLVNGSWRRIELSDCLDRLDATSTARRDWFNGTWQAGHRLRMRPIWRGDIVSAAQTGPWVRFRITR